MTKRDFVPDTHLVCKLFQRVPHWSLTIINNNILFNIIQYIQVQSKPALHLPHWSSLNNVSMWSGCVCLGCYVNLLGPWSNRLDQSNILFQLFHYTIKTICAQSYFQILTGRCQLYFWVRIYPIWWWGVFILFLRFVLFVSHVIITTLQQKYSI